MPVDVQPLEISADSFSQNTAESTSRVLACPPKKSVLGTVAAADTPVKYAFCPHIDVCFQDRLDATCSFKTSIWDHATEEQFAIENPEFYASLSKGGCASYFCQALLVIGMVLTYATPPVLISWAKTVGYSNSGAQRYLVKTDTFFPISVVLLAKIVTLLTALCFAVYWDRRGGGHRYLAMIIKWRGGFIAMGVYALSDIAEIEALGRVDPATYMVLSQLSLVGTAIASRLLVGIERSTFQWSILANLSIIIFGWLWTHHEGEIDSNENAMIFGYIICFAKMFMTALCSAIMRRQCRDSRDVPLLVQSAQASIAGIFYCIVVTPVVLLGIYPAMAMPWVSSGFFGGRSGPAGDATGWMCGKTYAVLGMYVFREIFCTYFIKRCNALFKNICNAIALVATYALAVWWLKELPFDYVKGILTVVIFLEILHYGFAETREIK